MSQITSLPMYWRHETALLWQTFWRHVQDYADLPDLTPPQDIQGDWTDHWLRADLALSMTCSLPFRTILRDQVNYVGTLDFGLGDRPGYYHSVAIRGNSKTIDTLAINSADSQSGWAAAQAQQIPSLKSLYETGGHAESLAAVADDTADLAFIDAVTWRLLEQFDPRAKDVRVDHVTAPTPGLPLITAKGRDPAPLQNALQSACRTFETKDTQAMGGPLSFVVLNEALYLNQSVPPAPDALGLILNKYPAKSA